MWISGEFRISWWNRMFHCRETKKFLAIDKGYQELVEEKKSTAFYTKLAAKARENAKHLESFHQW